MFGFVVQGLKSDDRDSSRLKNGLYPKKPKDNHNDTNTMFSLYSDTHEEKCTMNIPNLSKYL